MGARRRCTSGVTRRLRVRELWVTDRVISFDNFETSFGEDISRHSAFVYGTHLPLLLQQFREPEAESGDGTGGRRRVSPLLGGIKGQGDRSLLL